ncbi:hypothetical protein CANTEDRAFT_119083 [Yamadazyma tenuis ATCC 10573]|uniref:Arrestin C-terminal-like domain-containing protein n=1 Tax=Candida tenuis (strain ATCC 10573 / BCRC 21748 / CBS 615 / JCM 9827 / NBRC 10315 / NRRL Y-1498 / VKM Y-70) TaxID=590646 RepID=G3AZ63_CANTC|nr:uncharacterized protein CANTEDRAFT_119083 [Yamadazyma tenuis ATCC 10573]EGV66018.1 hypothetical protein CANTEDRAFT_119083 [Yamadazyma tenuis ATCC 10573]
MPKKSANTSKQASLFDIRLKNHEHDVLILKGPPDDAASALLSGKIVLSVNEPFAIKKLNLELYAMLRLSFTDSVITTKGSYPKNVRHERKIYDYHWDNSEINKYLNNMYENSGLSAGINGPGSALARTSSTTSSSSLAALGSQRLTNYTLVKGNYEIPFSAILPGSIPESVEGLPGASVVYHLVATIDRGKFHSPMVAKKHLRVVRTLTTDSVELSETVAVDNTWPKKVEYSLTVPSKAIAVGSGTPISMMLVPLLKGLRLGEIKIALVEYYSYIGYVPPVKNVERNITEKVIPRPSEDDSNFQLDKWELQTFLTVPPSLSKCCQDCDILTNIKVRHKIKFTIGLVNPDGHVSELRASLPVSLFISPFVTVRSGVDDEVSDGDTAIRSNSSSYTDFSGLVAPPIYEQHIYDRLWSDVSPIESPITSGSVTPREIPAPLTAVQDFNMSPIDSVQLNENLRLLSLQRQSQESGTSTPTPLATPTPERATFSLDEEGDYFAQRRPPLSSNNVLMSPGAFSPVHLSRTQSESVLNISQVPSYHEAIRQPDEEELSPAYEPPLPGSKINLDEANKTFEQTTRSSRPGSGTVSPVSPLPSNLPRPGAQRRSSSSGCSDFSAPDASSQSTVSVAMPSSRASDRTAVLGGSVPIRSSSSLSLHNVHFLNKKKDKR